METKIIIPKSDNDGSSNQAVINNALRIFCEQFGGATSWDGQGVWTNQEGRLYRDDVTIIVSAATEKTSAVSVLSDLANAVLAATDQEAVFVSVDGKADIIEK